MRHIVGTFLAAGAILLSAVSQAATSPFDITDNMMPGWNLGNALDALGGETNWGNPLTTQAMINAVAEAGFKSLRVPVSWDEYATGTSFTISTSRLARVEEVVNYGLKNGMYVIINVHHTSSSWEDPTYANEDAAKDRLTKYWQQIATRFRAYDDHLIFEVMNEPRCGDDWWGSAEYLAVINDLNAAALSTIRATGGNNASRLVMLPTYAAAHYDFQVNAFTVPSDSMVAVSMHAYLPYGFALNQSGTSSFTDTATLDSLFSRLQTRFIAKGVPVVLGEWASTNKNNLAERIKHASYFQKGATKVRIPTLLWDNNVYSGSTDLMGQLNRSTLSWVYPDLITAIMQGASAWNYGSRSSSSSVESSAAASSSSSSSSSKASSSAASSASSSKASSNASSASGSVKASYAINNDWSTGYCAVVTVSNSGSSVSFSGTGWNSTLAAGASNTSIGFCATR